MGQFTDGKPLPAMPPGIQPLHAGDNDGDENSTIQSQAWNADSDIGITVPLIRDDESSEYGSEG